MTSTTLTKWYRIRWFTPEDTKADQSLIWKLDLLIVPYALLSYWTKYIDQSNLNNAYVSGMKEDLGFEGNELVQLQTFYTVGAVVGQIPFLFLFTYIPMYWLVPSMDVAWGIFTLLQYRATSFTEMAAYRFLVGWFEAAFFPAMHYILGSWYRGDEIARRGGIFYVGLTLGTLTASLIQADASASLDGAHGLAGWRWMYIICSVITIPIGIIGAVVLPGTPDQPNRLFLKQHDIDLASERLRRAGHAIEGKFHWGTIKRLANCSINYSTGGYLLWLKSLNRYSDSRLNELGAIAPALGILYILIICFASDLSLGPAWAITASHTWNIIGLVILVIWHVPESALWLAFMTTYSSVAMSSVLYGWVNSELRASPGERSFTLVLINAVSQSTTAWTPLLVFSTVDAPQYPKGWAFNLANAVCLIVTAHIINFYIERQNRTRPEVDSDVAVLETVSDRDAHEGRDTKALAQISMKAD